VPNSKRHPRPIEGLIDAKNTPVALKIRASAELDGAAAGLEGWCAHRPRNLFGQQKALGTSGYVRRRASGHRPSDPARWAARRSWCTQPTASPLLVSRKYGDQRRIPHLPVVHTPRQPLRVAADQLGSLGPLHGPEATPPPISTAWPGWPGAGPKETGLKTVRKVRLDPVKL